jgi:hypothetical protein
MYLVVIQAFGIYNRGDEITNTTTIAQILASEFARCVVSVSGNPSPPPVAPNFFSGFIALGTGSTSFVEMVGSGYARVAATFGPIFGASSINTSAANFNATGTWPTQTQFGLYDASGNLLLWWTDTTPSTLTNGQQISVHVGDFKITCKDLTNAPNTASVIFAPGASVGSLIGGVNVVAGVPVQVASGQIGAM